VGQVAFTLVLLWGDLFKKASHPQPPALVRSAEAIQFTSVSIATPRAVPPGQRRGRDKRR
jgi:hypothetical protein